uniref:DIRP domain-containing protein n=1 Tax=Timema monikensis TaxID=170555 RepID=A0A7R9HLI9_9NEOP|nr:unnamed protein product [Timema monikensis]
MADQLERGLDESAAALLSFRNGTHGYNEVKQELDKNSHFMDREHIEEPILGPAALGLQRVGEEKPPRPLPTQPGLILNRRGMPARIRKRNRLFFDDDVVSTLLPRSSPKRPKNSTIKKAVATSHKNLVSHAKKHQTTQHHINYRESHAYENSHDQPDGSLLTSDKKVSQRLGMRLRNLLKLPKAHKWVCYEWFYSNIDKVSSDLENKKKSGNMFDQGKGMVKPLFEGDNDFMTCLKESFPQIKTRKLTRVEWCQIRRLMGKPRRCSQAFFEEERRELERKRTKIRLLQQRKTADISNCKDLPSEIPLQLVIGTRVTARLRRPQDGLFTGSIDAVDTSNSTYRVTFERPGLGTHSVPDYEVLSNETPETITISSFAQKFRPRTVVPFMSSPRSVADPSSPRSSSLSSFSSSSTKSKIIPADGMLGGFPVKFLDMVVRLSKILNSKKAKIKSMKEMNADAEKMMSFGSPVPDDFQRRYASIIIELERLNKDLAEYLSSVQSYCVEIAPEPSLVEMLTPTHLRDRTLEEASQLVKTHNELTECSSTRSLSLITQLTSLMLQIKVRANSRTKRDQSLSDADRNAYEMKVLQNSIDEIRSTLKPSNQQSFQNCVEVHIQHIQLGLSQCGSMHPFMIQRIFPGGTAHTSRETLAFLTLPQ